MVGWSLAVKPDRGKCRNGTGDATVADTAVLAARLHHISFSFHRTYISKPTPLGRSLQREAESI